MSDDEKAAEDFLNSMPPLKMAAYQLHEMYSNLREAGFSRKEALFLTSKMMTGETEE